MLLYGVIKYNSTVSHTNRRRKNGQLQKNGPEILQPTKLNLRKDLRILVNSRLDLMFFF